MLLALIALCEVGFWLFIAAGLCARYLLRRRRLGAVLLACAPLVDVVLLVASVIDLHGGGQARTVHALAAIYIGVSVGFGHSMIRWADARFAHWVDKRPLPQKPKYGSVAVRRELGNLLRHLVAWGVGSGLMLLAAWVVDDPDRTEVLTSVPLAWAVVLGIDAIVTAFDVVRAISRSDAGRSEAEAPEVTASGRH